jgi:hypothetical protein
VAKIRGIKPETWTDDKFVQLSPLARLLFIGMWNLACDNGHVEDNAVQLKIRLLPLDPCDVAALVDELIVTGQVERHDGFLKVIKLSEHQKIDLWWLTLCEWCEQDAHRTFNASDKRAKKGAGTSQVSDKSGNSLSPVSERRGDEVRGDDIPKRTTSRATALAQDWQPSEAHALLAAERFVDLAEEADKFRDWCAANGSTKKDWEATFRNWLRNARPSQKKSRPRNLPSVHDLERPPDGLSPDEYAQWEYERRQKRGRA